MKKFENSLNLANGYVNRRVSDTESDS